jgi:hypothetical protein
VSVTVTANQTVFGTPDSYLATALLFRGDAIKSSNKEEGEKRTTGLETERGRRRTESERFPTERLSFVLLVLH